MQGSIEQLVTEVAQTTGAPLPAVMDESSPTLRGPDLPSRDSFYLVGLIGGKDVGKSALVNALVGQPITDSTAYGPGTESVIAYTHASQVGAVSTLLNRVAPDRHTIVTHDVSALQRQVLLDLPDIDSIYTDHIDLTRRMLQHMLFPIWVQSVEKYADQQPQKLLAAVAAGNDPANFLFCLNKSDQLSSDDALQELHDDYAARVARVLNRPAGVEVFLVSAIHPDRFDLPALRQKLAQEKSAAVVSKSIDLAGKQQQRSVLAWLDEQRLPERALRLKRLEDQADELVAARITSQLLERAIPRILDDPAHRAALADEVMAARVARWPVVNVLDTLLSPLTSLWRRNVSAAPSSEVLIASQLDEESRTLSSSIQATFAQLQQTSPIVGPLYRRQKLWEAYPADAAAAELRDALVGALERQRAAATEKIARRGFFMPIVRWLLTIGAILWFPIVQPVLEPLLRDSLVQTTRGYVLLAVQLLSATYLLKSAAFLAIWLLALWMILRWDTQRRVNRLLARWRRPDTDDPSVNLAAATIQWSDALLDPVRSAREREESLAQRADDLRTSL